MGGSLQSLLPLLDLAAPGLGTAASTVAGVLTQANVFNKQTTPLKSPTNPFRAYRDGGDLKPKRNIQSVGKYTFDSNKVIRREDGLLVVKSAVNDIGNRIQRDLVVERLKDGSYALKDEGLLEVGNNTFNPNEIKASKKGNYYVGKDVDTGNEFGLVMEDGKYRYKKSTDKSKLNLTSGKDYQSLKPQSVTAEEAKLKLEQANAIRDYREFYNSDYAKRNLSESERSKKLKLLDKYNEDGLLIESVSSPMYRKGGLIPQLKFGGKLKEHNLPTHEQGGGLVDKMGNPSQSGVAEIEKQESIYTPQKGKTPYVFSDTLMDSNGKTFSQNAKLVEKKFNKPDQISKTTYKKLMDELTFKNEIAKKLQEQAENPTKEADVQMPNGGYMDDASMDAMINYDLRKKAYKNTLSNLQSGAFPRLPRTDMIPSGSTRILDNARANPLISQTAPKVPDITKPVTAQAANTNVPGGLDLGKVGGILKGVALAGSVVDAFQKPEQEQLRVPDFSKGDKAYTGLGGSFDPIRNEIVQQAKAGENQIMQNAGNFGQVMSRLNTLQSGVGRSLAQVGLQEKQYNDEIRMQKGSREDQKAQVTANELVRQQTANSQNKAMGQDLVANLLQNVNNYGTEFMKQDVLTKQLTALDKEKQRAFLTQLSLMNIKNPNFQINKDLINSDNPLSALTFKQ